MKKLIVVLASFLLILGLSTISMAAPFQNGSFEDGPPFQVNPFIPYMTLYAPDDSIDGWKLTAGSIDIVHYDYWVASDGLRSLDLTGVDEGTISQVFDTEPGTRYKVFFDMAGNPKPLNQGVVVLLASAGSEAIEFKFDSSGNTNDDMGWEEKSFIFEASSNLTTLEFASKSPGLAGGGPALDNVRVIPITSKSFIEDTMHPAGAVHAYPNLLWPPNNKIVKVKIKGYVLDEMSMARDGEGIGVSQVYLFVNDEKIILKDDEINKLNPDGSFSITVPLKAKKKAVYKIKLFASDTVAEEDDGPNSGLVDLTAVTVPHDMSGKDKKDKKKKKHKKK